jgi:hypothetical protein
LRRRRAQEVDAQLHYRTRPTNSARLSIEEIEDAIAESAAAAGGGEE